MLAGWMDGWMQERVGGWVGRQMDKYSLCWRQTQSGATLPEGTLAAAAMKPEPPCPHMAHRLCTSPTGAPFPGTRESWFRPHIPEPMARGGPS